MGLIVRAIAAAQRVPTDALERWSKFSDGEREMLAQLAPYAAPYVPKLLELMPKLAAWGYAGLFTLLVAQRASEIKREAQRERERVERGDESEPSGD